MGLASTAKKIQGISDKAEQLYSQLQDLQGRMVDLEEELDETHATVTDMDDELREQRALLEALADAEGIDPEAVLEDEQSGEEQSVKK
ncbi:MAG: DUF5798 family protein [Natrialbaceae archaeon]|nr:DUF5798 family protein [Natrialbaceae archaeon]